eukprot:11198136-Lingulodinium_polyedra.AAC.1
MAEALATAPEALVGAQKTVDDLQNDITTCDKEMEELDRPRKTLVENALLGSSEDATETNLQARAQLLGGFGISGGNAQT